MIEIIDRHREPLDIKNFQTFINLLIIRLIYQLLSTIFVKDFIL